VGSLVCLCFLVIAKASSQETQPAGDDAFTALTLNIRYNNPGDGKNAWPARRDAVIQYLKQSGADFIGLQEATPSQLVEVAEKLSGYAFLARTREADGIRGEATPLFWRADRWTLDPKHHGTTWLSTTPDVPGSKSWDSSLPRIVSWGRFIEKNSGRGIWIYNTHFDHRGQQARLEAGRVIARLIGDSPHNDEPVIVMGDFNCPPDSEPIKALCAGAGTEKVELLDAWKLTNPDEAANATWNGWNNTEQGRRIDLIVVSKGTEVVSASIDRPLVNGRPISDHWPVRTLLRGKEKTKAKQQGDSP
jgi:endonuclease/exonuclease/phosphatase family metal-dependent hydrolase